MREYLCVCLRINVLLRSCVYVCICVCICVSFRHRLKGTQIHVCKYMSFRHVFVTHCQQDVCMYYIRTQILHFISLSLPPAPTPPPLSLSHSLLSHMHRRMHLRCGLVPEARNHGRGRRRRRKRCSCPCSRSIPRRVPHRAWRKGGWWWWWRRRSANWKRVCAMSGLSLSLCAYDLMPEGGEEAMDAHGLARTHTHACTRTLVRTRTRTGGELNMYT
jgi:hypothetical protein